MANELFAKQLVDDPNYQGSTEYDNHRLAFGKAGTATRNITLAKVKTWLAPYFSGLFLNKAQNLNDVANKATARTNLSVYSKAETYSQTEINAKETTLINRLGGLSYRWAGNISAAGAVTKIGGDITVTGSYTAHTYRLTHNLGNTDYAVDVNILGVLNEIIFGVPHINKQSNYCDIVLKNASNTTVATTFSASILTT